MKNEEQILEVSIDSLSEQGFGVARKDGCNIIVPFTVPGDRCQILFDSSGNSGHLQHLVQASEYRIEPRCPSENCQGCLWQHIQLKQQRLFKQERLQQKLRSLKFKPDNYDLLPLQGGMLPWGYAYKARLIGGAMEGRWTLGAFHNDQKISEPFTACPILKPELNQLLMSVTRYIEEKDARITMLEALWSPIGNYGVLSMHMHSAIRMFTKSIHELQQEQPNLKSVIITSDDHETRRYGDDTLLYFPEEHIFGPLRFAPSVYVPDNLECAELLITIIQQRIKELQATSVLDVHAGSGMISLALASKNLMVHAYEEHPRSSFFIRRNIQATHLYSHVALIESIQNLPRNAVDHIIIQVIPDAPVCPPKTFSHLDAHHLTVVLYNGDEHISYLKDLKKHGWQLSAVCPIDMYPQTPDVSVVAYFSRKK